MSGRTHTSKRLNREEMIATLKLLNITTELVTEADKLGPLGFANVGPFVIRKNGMVTEPYTLTIEL